MAFVYGRSLNFHVSSDLWKAFVRLLRAPDVAQSLGLIEHDSSLSTGLLSHFVQLILDVLGVLSVD